VAASAEKTEKKKINKSFDGGISMKDAEKSSQPGNAADLTGSVIWKTVKTPAVRKLVSAIVQEALKDWSGDSKFKARMSSSVQNMVDSVLSSQTEADNKSGAAIGKLITAFARETNDRLKQGIQMIDDPRQTGINDFIINTDFGEIKEWWTDPKNTFCRILM